MTGLVPSDHNSQAVQCAWGELASRAYGRDSNRLLLYVSQTIEDVHSLLGRKSVEDVEDVEVLVPPTN